MPWEVEKRLSLDCLLSVVTATGVAAVAAVGAEGDGEVEIGFAGAAAGTVTGAG